MSLLHSFGVWYLSWGYALMCIATAVWGGFGVRSKRPLFHMVGLTVTTLAIGMFAIFCKHHIQP